MSQNGMKPDEALNQIMYLKEIMEQSRLRIATGYRFFYLWGLLWTCGYLGSMGAPVQIIGRLWLMISLIGAIGSIMIGIGIGKTKKPSVLLKKLGVLSLLMFIIAGTHFHLLFRGTLNLQLIHAYWPFHIGVIYLANSLFFGRDLTYIGMWIILAAAISVLIPFPFFYLWLAVACGGGLIVTGWLLQRQVVLDERISPKLE